MQNRKAGFRSVFSAALILFIGSVAPMWGAADRITRLFNYPNPFQPSGGEKTTVAFDYENNSGSEYTLEYYVYIYDLTGYRVLVRKQTDNVTTSNPNRITFTWNGHNDKGKRVAPGVYFIKIVTTGASGTVENSRAFTKAMVR